MRAAIPLPIHLHCTDVRSKRNDGIRWSATLISMSNTSVNFPASCHILLKSDCLSTNDLSYRVTGLLDLPDELLLQIYRYLSVASVLRSFYTPDQPHARLHTTIRDYSQCVELNQLTTEEYDCIQQLLVHSKHPLRPHSLTLSDEYIRCLIERFFSDACSLDIQPLFDQLEELILRNCSLGALRLLCANRAKLSQVVRFHLVNGIEKPQRNFPPADEYQTLLHGFLFSKPTCSFRTIDIRVSHGLNIRRSLVSHPTIEVAHLTLQTLDDLYILLDGLVPNARVITAEIMHARLLTCRPPKPTASCSRLRRFTLLEHGIGLQLADLKHVFACIANISELILNVRDTPDRAFCLGQSFESTLHEHLPSLNRFDYTVTHRITNRDAIGGFTRWPMSVLFYEDDGCQWTHVYSCPWPSARNDRRHLPAIPDAVSSDVQQTPVVVRLSIDTTEKFHVLNMKSCHATQVITTSLPIPIQLPSRIIQVVLTDQLPTRSSALPVQRSVRYLFVQRRLIHEDELITLARFFPNIEYLGVYCRDFALFPTTLRPW